MDGPRTLTRWWRANRGWLGWKLRHPLGRYHDYYVRQVETRLDRGDAHVSLGARSVEDERGERAGRMILDLLVADGLAPEQRVVDYGCGSLRVGRHLIAHLAPDRYLGADVTERFYREGLATLPPDLVAEKRPRFRLVDERWPLLATEPAPDVLVSIGVLIHVPRRELAAYLDRIASLVGPSTRAWISFFDGPRHARLSEMTWTWPAARLVAEARARGLATQVVDLPDWPLAEGRAKRLLRLERARAASA